jgi:hypothetical protein
VEGHAREDSAGCPARAQLPDVASARLAT